jgi:hypothetical protein
LIFGKEGNEAYTETIPGITNIQICNYASKSLAMRSLEDIVQHTMIKIWKKGLDLNVNTSLKRIPV